MSIDIKNSFIFKFLKYFYISLKNLYGRFILILSKKDNIRIVVGASGIVPHGWVGTEIQFLNLLKESTWRNFFQENQVKAILAEHVWEHLTLEEGELAAKNCFKFLKKGGYVRVAVPDGYFPDEKYINHVKINGIGDGADDHKVLYNYKTFSEVFEKAGFQINLLEYFDEDGKFTYHEWSKDDGMIYRSKRYDKRNKDKIRYTSIILDAIKK
tara:strand:- start:39518 stop:40153 length:636 start_codon:yes stop_codon:yes gene_type:complete